MHAHEILLIGLTDRHRCQDLLSARGFQEFLAQPQLGKVREGIIGVGGRTGSADFAIGGSVNAAFRLFTKALTDRGVKDGVRVNAINPGYIKTERLKIRLEGFAAEHGVDLSRAEAELAKASGVSRFGEPTEIAAAVAFLASTRCGYCHGALLDVDGGQTRTL